MKERLVAIATGDEAKAYLFPTLRRAKVIEDQLQDKRYVIFFEEGARTALDAASMARSREVGAVGVFSPVVEERSLTFHYESGKIVDDQTGSAWNLMGIATDGTLAGKRLDPVEHIVSFAFAWLMFRPDTQIVMPDKGNPRRNVQ